MEVHAKLTRRDDMPTMHTTPPSAHHLARQEFPAERKLPFLTSSSTFKVQCENFGETFTQGEILKTIDKLCEFIPFQARPRRCPPPSLLKTTPPTRARWVFPDFPLPLPRLRGR